MKTTLLSGLAILGAAGWALASAPDDSFLKKIPQSANAAMYMDVTEAYTSALGRKDEWAKRYSQTQHASLNSIPPTVEKVLVAAQYDFSRMAPLWRIGVMKTDWLISLSEIAKKANSTIEEISGKSVVHLTRDAYIAPFGDKQLVTLYPGNRQVFGRWLDGINEGGYSGQSAYLRGALANNDNATMVAAVDLKHAMDAGAVQAVLARLPSMKGQSANAAELAKLFANMKGFTFSAKVTDRVNAKLRIDFNSSPKAYAAYLPAVVDDLLSEGGAIIDDFREWTPSFDDTSMTLEGRLSASNLRRVLSLFEIPGDVGYRQVGDKSDAPGERAEMAAVSKRYYNSLNDLLTELKNVRMIDNIPLDARYKRYAYWYEAYAQKIGQLNSRGVDPELAAFGAQLSYDLGNIVASLRGVPTKIDALDQTIYYQRGWGWWGGGSSNAGAVLGKEGKAMTDDIKVREESWKKIDDQMAQLKAKLTQKYNMPF